MGKHCTKFDYLSNLYETNSEAFESHREEAIEEYMQWLPEERQTLARQSQWVLDGALAKCKDPNERIQLLAELMADNLSELSKALTAAVELR